MFPSILNNTSVILSTVVQAMNGMLPDAKKQLSEPMFTYIQQKPKETIPVVFLYVCG